ncbi:hypothetical protein BH23PSE1_BH23PSE1_02380 [soil metagenome]
MRFKAVRAHTVIPEAIRERNEETAARRKERHVAAYGDVATGAADSTSASED